MPTQYDPQQRRYALRGRIVTMNDNFDVLDDGILYIHNGEIVAVLPYNAPAPDGFEDFEAIETGGTIFPGLIELHNHLSYNILPLWDVPKKFLRRENWRNHPEKRRLVTAPMYVLGRTPSYVEAIVRYVECKCLVAGVTTSQGISLFGVGVNKYYRGIVRNVETPTHPRLPKAYSKISDVKDAEKFQERLDETDGTYIIHLSEGVDDKALKHFKNLELPDGDWAIDDGFAGIHATALQAEDFETVAEHEGSIVWSPLSNYILYGQTTDVAAAKKAGVKIGLGSDWSPSGSKNLLGELKVAQVAADRLEAGITPRDLVAMVTREAAEILQWDKILGTLEAGKQADVVIIKDTGSDPYEALIAATEHDVSLVLIGGIPRLGTTSLMSIFDLETEIFQIADEERALYLGGSSEPAMQNLSLQTAKERLADGMANIVELARDLEKPDNLAAQLSDTKEVFSTLREAYKAVNRTDDDFEKDVKEGLISESTPMVFLDLEDDDFDSPFDETLSEKEAEVLERAKIPYSMLLEEVTLRLDPLTIADDPEYFLLLNAQQNVPDQIKQGIFAFYQTEKA